MVRKGNLIRSYELLIVYLSLCIHGIESLDIISENICVWAYTHVHVCMCTLKYTCLCVHMYTDVRGKA